MNLILRKSKRRFPVDIRQETPRLIVVITGEEESCAKTATGFVVQSVITVGLFHVDSSMSIRLVVRATFINMVNQQASFKRQGGIIKEMTKKMAIYSEFFFNLFQFLS